MWREGDTMSVLDLLEDLFKKLDAIEKRVTNNYLRYKDLTKRVKKLEGST